jgi:hypothetical protein
MPNHITNKIELIGEKKEIEKLIEKFATVHPKRLNLAHDGSIICVDKNSEFAGWYDKENDLFQFYIDRLTNKKSKGLPWGIEFQYNEEFIQMPDFNKIIPQPEIIKDTEFSSDVIDRAKNAIRIAISKDKLLESLEQLNKMSLVFKRMNNEKLNDVIKAIRCYQETGFFYWYDWNIANWGTKWNSYSCKKLAENIFLFDTAWSGVTKLIKEMSKEFPDIVINYKYADEDAGYNTGDMVIQSGRIIKEIRRENGSNSAYEIYLELHPDCDYIKMIRGEYQHIDSAE